MSSPRPIPSRLRLRRNSTCRIAVRSIQDDASLHRGWQHRDGQYHRQATTPRISRTEESPSGLCTMVHNPSSAHCWAKEGGAPFFRLSYMGIHHAHPYDHRPFRRALIATGLLAARTNEPLPAKPRPPSLEGLLTWEVRDADTGAPIPCKLTFGRGRRAPRAPEFTHNDIGRPEGDLAIAATIAFSPPPAMARSGYCREPTTSSSAAAQSGTWRWYATQSHA